MKIHFISIGGSAMHNLAIAMHNQGNIITGSDDEIFEPSYSRLKTKGLLPEAFGWFPEKINSDIDTVILGMHARADNPELLKAKELGLKIYSYPEFLYEQSKNKTRIVIGGSHGKTSVTSMVMHVFKLAGLDFDYMVGSQIQGFETMVHFSEDSKFAVFEGDEYLSSPIDLRPKFHLYKPHIAVITGIAWDHVNVFPTFDNYVEQFKIFTDLIEPKGKLIYYQQDDELKKIVVNIRNDISAIPYNSVNYKTVNEKTYLVSPLGEVPINVFGEHNMQNIQAALYICKEAGISEELFYNYISTFSGAAKRLQLLNASSNKAVFLDFAHSPSKLKATISAVKNQFAKRKLIACFELHTFSSLSQSFLPEYKNAMNDADVAAVFFNSHTFEMKKMQAFTKNDIIENFGRNDIFVFTDSDELKAWILSKASESTNLLMMTSGNFNSMSLPTLADEFIK